MSDILERLCRRAASKNRFDADQELLKAAVVEIRQLRADLAALRTQAIVQIVQKTAM